MYPIRESIPASEGLRLDNLSINDSDFVSIRESIPASEGLRQVSENIFHWGMG